MKISRRSRSYSTLTFLFLFQILVKNTVESWSIIEKPLSFFDLSNNTSKFGLEDFLFEYSKINGNLEQYRLLKHDEKNQYMILGAKNRLITISLDKKFQINIKEYDIPTEAKNYPEYILALVPVIPTMNNLNNMLICKTGPICPRCIQSLFDENDGQFYSFNNTLSSCKRTPQFINDKSYQSVFYYTPKSENSKDHLLYSASTQGGGRQYISLYNTDNADYSEHQAYKYVGQMAGKSKEFVKFLEYKEKIFLFQYMNSKIVDPLEKSRDISESAAIVSQICKNDEGTGMFKELYSELKAQINCFKDATPQRGNSANFRFEILKFLSDFVLMNKDEQQKRRLFYGVFNTPKETPTGTAICFFDINDIERIFKLNNFDYTQGEMIQSYKFDKNFNIQNCPVLTDKQKNKYRIITNQLRHMKTGAYPIRRRKASFMTLHRYRITTLVIDQLMENTNKSLLENENKFDNLNVIYAGTDNGKVLRIAHYFTNEYFENEDVSEEHVEVLEEIQLFDTKTSIDKIQILNKNGIKQVIAIASNQIRSVPTNFCQLYSTNCQTCVSHNRLDDDKCHWYNSTCISNYQMKSKDLIIPSAHNVAECQSLTTTPVPTTTITTTQAPKTTELLTANTITTKLSIFDINVNETALNSSVLIKPKNWGSGKQLDRNILIIILVISCFFILIIGVCSGYVIKAFNVIEKFRSKSSLNGKFGDSNKNKDPKKNLYHDQKQLGLKIENSKVRIARSASKNLNESVEKTLEFSNNSSMASDSDNSHLYEKYCICTKKLKSPECFTVQNDYSLLPNIQQSLPPEYFKIANLRNQLKEAEKSRLSSDLSTDSSYVFNIANYSHTYLVNQSSSNQTSPIAKSVIEADTSSSYSNTLALRPPVNVGKLTNIPNNRYQNENCIIVDDDDENYQDSEINNASQKPQIDMVLYDEQKRCSIISSNLSFSASSDTSSKSIEKEKYCQHHHLKKQGYNPYYEGNLRSQLVINNISRQCSDLPNNLSADAKNPNEFYVNNSYV